MCGYEMSGHIDINGIIEKDYNESCAKNDFLMELKEGSLLHNDARGEKKYAKYKTAGSCKF